jgi:predicted permease
MMDVSFRIVGVTAEDFVEPQILESGHETGVWAPWDFNKTPENRKNSWARIWRSLFIVAKLSASTSQGSVEQSLSQLINDRWQSEVTGISVFNGWYLNFEMSQLKSYLAGDSQKTAMILVAALFGLVLIACVNISNLLMSRTAEKQRTMAIRTAIGAKRKHLFNEMLLETGGLISLSVLFGLVVASIGFMLIRNNMADLVPRAAELSLNLVSILTSLIIIVVLSLLFSYARYKTINYRQLSNSLNVSGKGSGVQVSKKVRQILISSQIAVASVLVLASLVLFGDALNVMLADKGFSTDNTHSMILDGPQVQQKSDKELISMATDIKAKLADLPQIQQVSQSRSPLSAFGIVTVSDNTDGRQYNPEIKSVDSNYFDMIGQRLVDGRVFSEADIRDVASVVVVNEVFAKEYRPDGPAIGEYLSFGDETQYQIIGVVKGIKLPHNETVSARVYSPIEQSSLQFLIRFNGSTRLTEKTMASYVNGFYSGVGLFEYEPLSIAHKRLLFPQLTALWSTSVIVFIVLLLSGVGIYGILNYNILMRKTELGTRMAIGAKRLALFSEMVMPYLGLELLFITVFTVVLISLLNVVASYFPLRQIINSPVSSSLNNNE